MKKKRIFAIRWFVKQELGLMNWAEGVLECGSVTAALLGALLPSRRKFPRPLAAHGQKRELCSRTPRRFALGY